MNPVRLGVLTVSDAVAAGTRQDASGAAIEAWASETGCTVALRAVTPDDVGGIVALLLEWCDSGEIDVALTTGGTGFTDRDVTPEATRCVIEREAPGIAEALRAHGAASTPFSWISRGVAGIRSRTLVVNLPGGTAAVQDGLAVLAGLLPHAVQLLRGVRTDQHPAPDA